MKKVALTVERLETRLTPAVTLSGVVRHNIALGFTQSREAEGNFVQGAYQEILNRPADAGGLKTFTDALVAGATREQVLQTLIASTEFAALHPNDANAAVFQALLGRPGSPAGTTPAALAAQILSGTEYRTNLVQEDYESFLLRPGLPTEVNAWVQTLAAGVRDEVVQAGFLASNEFASFQTGDYGLVTGFYVLLLQRAPDPSEVNGWLVSVGLPGAPPSDTGPGAYPVSIFNLDSNPIQRVDVPNAHSTTFLTELFSNTLPFFDTVAPSVGDPSITAADLLVFGHVQFLELGTVIDVPANLIPPGDSATVVNGNTYFVVNF